MVSRQECEFYLLRYVPDPVRNEFVSVGVILREAGGERGVAGRLALKFTSDWRRVRCMDADADIAMLEGLETELRRRFLEEPEGNLFHVLEDSFSNCVQMTTAKAYLAESMEAGVEELMRLYVEPQRREVGEGRQAGRAGSRLVGRAAIQAQMRGEFERAGVWELMRKRIEAAQYTRKGDPLRLDCGYRVGAGADATVRMFQSVSLDAGSEMAKVLAFSAPGLMAGVQRVEKSWLELTAVVEPMRQGSGDRGQGNTGADGGDLDAERMAAYRYAVETMEEHRIRVVTTADLGRLAETARRELGV